MRHGRAPSSKPCFPGRSKHTHGLLAHPRTRTHRWRRQIVVVAVELPRRAPLSPSGFSFVREQRAAAARAGPGPTCHRPQRTPQRMPAPRERQPGAWPHRSASLDAVTRADPKPSPPGPTCHRPRGLRQRAPAPRHGRVSASCARARLSATPDAVQRVDLDFRSRFCAKITIGSLQSQSSPWNLLNFQKIAEKPPVFKFK